MRYIIELRCVALLGLVSVAQPSVANAQQMNFSYYSDYAVSGDLETFYAAVDGYDNSSGCTHYQYDTYAEFVGPSVNLSQTFPGTSAYFSTPAIDGDYTIGSNLTVSCSCFGAGLSAGGLFDGIGIRKSSYVSEGMTTGGRCAWSPYGVGCPGTCGSSHTTNSWMGQCFSGANFWKRCVDLVKGGKCWSYRVICVGINSPNGRCT